MSDLAHTLSVPLMTLHGEAKRLLEATILTGRTLGRQRLVRANAKHPAARALTDLVTVTYGPLPVLREEFADLPGAARVLLFGSWAARYRGEPGPPPNDVDVLVVGPAKRAAVYAAADRAQARLVLPVNPVLASARRWGEASDALMRQIKASASVLLHTTDDGEGTL